MRYTCPHYAGGSQKTRRQREARPSKTVDTFIITKPSWPHSTLALPNTVEDFWRMILEKGSHTIVALQKEGDKALTSIDKFPQFEINVGSGYNCSNRTNSSPVTSLQDRMHPRKYHVLRDMMLSRPLTWARAFLQLTDKLLLSSSTGQSLIPKSSRSTRLSSNPQTPTLTL